MKVQELPMQAFYAHLHRQPIPEIIDDACFAAIANVEAQYGDTITHGAGLEVRLGDTARYVDYIMNIDVDNIPFVPSLWFEIDYEEFAKGGPIEPCLFANVNLTEHSYAEYWDKTLPPFMGEKRATRLRAPLDRVTAALPRGATIKQIGTMSGRGELDIMRLVIIFSTWESVFGGMASIGWNGDIKALRKALEPWKEAKNVAVNIDLGEKGVLPKIGIEVCSNWRHPLLVDKFIDRLEAAGLCLPSKGEALRRWIRILPDADPFIQTLIAYFKLNYKDGRITEAKAYLEQSPYIHHHYFAAYDRPLCLELELADGKATLPAETALALIRDCGKNRVRHMRFTGSVAGYEALTELLQECRKQDVATEIVITEPAQEGWLSSLVAAGMDAVLVEMADEKDETALAVLHTLQKLGLANVRARWYMHRGNAGRLEAVVKSAAGSGVRELLLTGARPQAGSKTKTQLPDPAQMEATAAFIREYEGKEDSSSPDLPQETEMLLTVESCFSQLRAVMGGKEAKRNPNMGIERGCEAGKSFFAVRADGSFTPCLYMKSKSDTPSGEDPAHTQTGKLSGGRLPVGAPVCASAIVAYWENSLTLQGLRNAEQSRKDCADCCYQRRCLSCQASEEDGSICPYSCSSAAGQ